VFGRGTELGRHGRQHTRAKHRRIQPSADRQQAVADALPFEAHAILPGKEFVLGIALQGFWRGFARLMVGGRTKDQPMHGFDAPALRHEFTGEPIEEFGMRRSRATRAEIARRGHETPTEMMLPEAVDQDAGGERVGRTGKPVGKRRSPARGSRPEETRFRLGGGIGAFWSLTLLVLVALEDRWKSRLHFVARLLILAAQKDEGA